MGDSSASITTPRHQAVVNRLRERIGQYRRHHLTCQDKYERSLPLRQAHDRQDAVYLHQRALEGRTKIMNNMKVKQQEPGSKASKQDQPPNGLEKCASTASIILQKQILKRKLDQSLNSSSQTTGHSLGCEPNEQADCLTKYQRGITQDDIHSLAGEQQINMQSAQQGERYPGGPPHDQHQHSELRGHQLISDKVSNSRQSPLITNSTDHNPVETFQGNRIASPSNSFQGTEFKQETQVTVSCDGGHANSNSLHETMSASEPLAHTAVELRATNSRSFSEGNNDSQHLREQLDDFERILQNYQQKSGGIKRTNNGPSSGLDAQQPQQQQQQLQTPQLKQSDAMSRSPSQEQVNDRNAHTNSLPTGQYGPGQQSGSLQLQEMARQSAQLAQINQVRAPQRMPDSPHQRIGLTHLQQLQLVEKMKQAASQSAQQQQQPNAVSQPQQTPAPPYFQSQYPQNQYQSGFEEQNQTATHVSSSYSAAQYQRALQAQQAGQQGFYGFPGQHQNMAQKLAHQSLQDKSQVYVQQRQSNRQIMIQQQQQPTQGQVAGYESAQQTRPMPAQDLPVPYSVGMRLASQSSPAYQRQHSMPHISSQSYPQQNFYQQAAAYQNKDQPVNLLQQTKQQAPSYSNYFQRRHSFPFNRSMSQPADGYVGMQEPYAPANHVNPQSRGPALLQQSLLEGRASMTQSSLSTQNKTVFTGGRPAPHTPVSYTNTPVRMLQPTANQTAATSHYNLAHMSSAQSTRNYPADGNTDFSSRLQRENSFGSFQAPDVPVTSSDSQFSPFPSPRTLEKAPSFSSLLQANSGEFGSLLDQASANPGNLQTTFSGSIPNLDLLGEILGQ